MTPMTRFLLALALVTSAQAQTAQDLVSDANARESNALTVYPNDLDQVKERRRVLQPQGVTQLNWRDVSAQMRAETALLQSMSGTPVRLLEQNFDFDLLTPQKLLDKYVGQNVTVLRQWPGSGEERRETATVLANNNGTVLRFADRIETGVPGRIVFDKVPPTLRDRPTLSMLLESDGGPQSLELSYLTGGLGWQADYVANLSPDGQSLNLSGWITLSNRSGVAYHDTRLQLVAGTVHRVPGPQPRMGAKTAMALLASADTAQEALMDYHLNTIARPTSIADNQTKQLALLSASSVPVRREYLLTGSSPDYRERHEPTGQRIKPSVFIEFDNRQPPLGLPLPAGVIRVYARDSQGAAQFVGEDRIGHTARNETVRLRLGEAFDITGERQQTDFRKLGNTLSESSYRIELRNAKPEKVTVKVREPFLGDWEILRESQPSRKDSAQAASWQIDVPADGTAVLTYSVRVRW